MVQDGKLCHCIVEAVNTDNGQPVTMTGNCCGAKYWCILHNKDLHDDGTLKHSHYHVIFEVQDRHRKSYYIDLCKSFFANVTNDAQVSADVLLNKQKRSNIRYLIHLDEDGKTRYNADDVITNDKATMRNCFEDCITVDYVLDVINRSDGMTDVIKTLGLDTYKTYSHAIDIMWKENK